MEKVYLIWHFDFFPPTSSVFNKQDCFYPRIQDVIYCTPFSSDRNSATGKSTYLNAKSWSLFTNIKVKISSVFITSRGRNFVLSFDWITKLSKLFFKLICGLLVRFTAFSPVWVRAFIMYKNTSPWDIISVIILNLEIMQSGDGSAIDPCLWLNQRTVPWLKKDRPLVLLTMLAPCGENKVV